MDSVIARKPQHMLFSKIRKFLVTVAIHCANNTSNTCEHNLESELETKFLAPWPGALPMPLAGKQFLVKALAYGPTCQ